MMLHQNFKQINMKDFFVAANFPKTPSPKPARIPPQTPDFLKLRRNTLLIFRRF